MNTTTPWTLRRMKPYPAVPAQPYARVELDPATQTGAYYDAAGNRLEMGKHGTSRGTETQPQSTNLDSLNDTDHDQDNEQD